MGRVLLPATTGTAPRDDGCLLEQIGIILDETLLFRWRSIGKREPCVKKNRRSGTVSTKLTRYDMCKAAEKGMTIAGINPIKKNGGKSGLWQK